MRASNLINFLNPAAPKGLIPSAADWVKTQQIARPQLRAPQARAWRKEVIAEDEHFNCMEHDYERTPGDEFCRVRWTSTPAASLFHLEGCRVLGEQGTVISPDNRVFADFTLPPGDDWNEHSCFKRRRIPAVKKLAGWHATITWPESRFFFHWMLEALPRMAVLGAYLDILDGIFVPSALQEFHRASLQLLGVHVSKLIPLDVNSHYQPEHLFVPHFFCMYNPPLWLPQWYKQAYLAGKTNSSTSAASARRIYVSRADAPARRVANEADLVRMLEAYGFDSVRLSEHPFEQQARIFNEAEIIVGANGAGLSNLVFCTSKATVVELLPPRWMAPCFMALASTVGCRYRHLVAEEMPKRGPRDPQRDDIRVPVGNLETLLRTVLP